MKGKKVLEEEGGGKRWVRETVKRREREEREGREMMYHMCSKDQ